MTARAYYNEFEPAAAHVLRQLIRDGVIAPGEVDSRSIKEVQPDDLRGFTQAHFFAGGGLWSVAARLAGWPDDKPIWTGSCPCQPFSVAGKGAGEDDPRHLWPDFFRLIRAGRPPVVMGEQVSGKAGYGWLDGIRSDLETEGYASRGVDIPACAVDAPHIRQRLYWIAAGEQGVGLANAYEFGAGEERQQRGREFVWLGGDQNARPGDGSGMADAGGCGHRGWPEIQERGAQRGTVAERPGGWRGAAMERASRDGRREGGPEHGIWSGRHASAGPGISNGTFWSGHEWRVGADGKARRVKPGLRLLVDGMAGRVGLLRIGGNGIVVPLAAEVIAAFMDVEGMRQ